MEISGRRRYDSAPVNRTSLDILNARFGIAGHAAFQSGPGDLPVVDVSNDQASARVALQGAQLLSWSPRGVEPVIWVSEAAAYMPGKPVRGGIPVCWPWFGAAADARLPKHGFARTTTWDVAHVEIVSDGATRVTFRLTPSADTQDRWPVGSELWYVVSIGSALELELITRNNGDKPIAITEALHTYFNVSDVRHVTVRGLDGCSYVDEASGDSGTQRGSLRFNGAIDRAYLHAVEDCFIDDPGLKRVIHIAKRSSGSTVVWNPGFEQAMPEWQLGDSGSRHMLCVESANIALDAVTVAAGADHRLWTRYSVESLG